jgi:hypothetical protein
MGRGRCRAGIAGSMARRRGGCVRSSADVPARTNAVRTGPVNGGTGPDNAPVGAWDVIADVARASANRLRAPAKGLRAPANGLRARANGLQEPSNSLQEPSNCLQAPSDRLQAPSNCLQGPSNSLQGPSNCLRAPANALRAPANRLQEPAILFLFGTFRAHPSSVCPTPLFIWTSTADFGAPGALGILGMDSRGFSGKPCSRIPEHYHSVEGSVNTRIPLVAP